MTQNEKRERKRLEKRSVIEFFSFRLKIFFHFFSNNNKTLVKKKTHNFKNFLYSLYNLNSK